MAIYSAKGALVRGRFYKALFIHQRLQGMECQGRLARRAFPLRCGPGVEDRAYITKVTTFKYHVLLISPPMKADIAQAR
jgi:hypothetical protein